MIPVVTLTTRSGRESFAPTTFLEEAIFGLAVRAHRLERQAHRDARRIQRLERELGEARAGAASLRADPGAGVGRPRKAVSQPLGDGWTFAFERDQGFLAVAKCDDAVAVEDRRRA